MAPNLLKPPGANETMTMEVRRTKHGGSLRISRRRNLTWWQEIIAVTWCPFFSGCVATFVWKADQNSAVLRYVKDNLEVTIVGFFAAWLVTAIISIILF